MSVMTSPHSVEPPRRLQETTLTDLLEWVYRRQKADVMSGRNLWEAEAEIDAREEGRARKAWSGCGCAQIETIARLGVRVDSSRWQCSAVHADAELVHTLVTALGRDDWLGAPLLQVYGRAGGIPEWDCRQDYEPLRDARDRVIQNRFEETVTVLDARGRPVETPLLFCPVTKYPSDDWVGMIRAEYRAWFAALAELGRRLGQRTLTKWRVRALGASAEPWLAP